MAGKNKIMQAVVSFAGTIDPSLGKAMDNVAGHLDKVNWKAVAVDAAVGGIAVATGKAVVEAGKYLAELGDNYNKAMNQLSASTGATGDELDALGESVKNIYAQNLGEDFNDVAEGLAATQKASDLAGEALEQATAAGFVLRDTFDYDISESARAASALMKNFNISAEEAYGLIATGAQNGADKNGDLLDTLNEYSAQFAALHRSRLGESFPHGSVDDLPHGLFVSELDFGLLGMDIDVDPRRVDRQVEKIGGRTGIGNQLLVSLQDRLEKIGGAEITPVHEKILFRTIALLGGSGTAHEARHPHDRRVGIDFQQVLFDMTPHHIDDPRSQRSSGQPIERLIVHQQFEPHLRIAERDPLKLGLDLPRGSRTLFEELTAGRHVVEQICAHKTATPRDKPRGLRPSRLVPWGRSFMCAICSTTCLPAVSSSKRVRLPRGRSSPSFSGSRSAIRRWGSNC